MATKTPARTLDMEYLDTVGFVADQGGRGFHLPVAMAIRGDGRVHVASRSHAESLRVVGVQVVSLKHEFFGKIGDHGRGDGQMTSPTALAIDREDNVYLADDALQRITIYDRDGNYLSKWGTPGSGDGEIDGPAGLAFDGDDNLLVVDHKNHRVQRFTKDGRFLGKFGSFGSGDGQFNLPWGITNDAQGFIYVADWRNDRIQKLTAEGEFVARFGSSGAGDGQLNRPSGVAVDSDGLIYVADWGNQRVQVLGPDGRFLAKLRGQATLSPWATEYMEANADELRARPTYVQVYEVDTDDPSETSARIEPYFWDPVAVTLDEQQRLYVLETGRHRFQVYKKVGL